MGFCNFAKWHQFYVHHTRSKLAYWLLFLKTKRPYILNQLFTFILRWHKFFCFTQQPAHEKIGVVDSQWIIHQVIPSLGSQVSHHPFAICYGVVDNIRDIIKLQNMYRFFSPTNGTSISNAIYSVVNKMQFMMHLRQHLVKPKSRS